MRADPLSLPLGVFKLKLDEMSPAEFTELVGGWEGLVELLGGYPGVNALIVEAWKKIQHDEDERDLLRDNIDDLLETVRELNNGQRTVEDTAAWIAKIGDLLPELQGYGFELPAGWRLSHPAYRWGNYIEEKEIASRLVYGRNRRGTRNHLLTYNGGRLGFSCSAGGTGGLYKFNEPQINGADLLKEIPDLCRNCYSMTRNTRYEHRFLGILPVDQ